MTLMVLGLLLLPRFFLDVAPRSIYLRSQAFRDHLTDREQRERGKSEESETNVGPTPPLQTLKSAICDKLDQDFFFLEGEEKLGQPRKSLQEVD